MPSVTWVHGSNREAIARLTGSDSHAPVNQFSISDNSDTFLLCYVHVSECTALLAQGSSLTRV